MLRKGCAGLALLLVLAVALSASVAAASVLPWYAVLFAGLFWTLLGLRLWRRLTHGPAAADAVDAGPADEGPMWSPFRSRGF